MNLIRSFGVLLIALIAFSQPCFSQSGGTFAITQSVIAGGGGNSAGGTFKMAGTAGQPSAGATSSGSNFQLTSGFWGGEAAPPTSVTISGRVSTPSGLNLVNARVALIDDLGIRRITITSPFGRYAFDNVTTGQNYTMTVSSKRYRFAPLILLISGSLTNLDFVGLD